MEPYNCAAAGGQSRTQPPPKGGAVGNGGTRTQHRLVLLRIRPISGGAGAGMYHQRVGWWVLYVGHLDIYNTSPDLVE